MSDNYATPVAPELAVWHTHVGTNQSFLQVRVCSNHTDSWPTRQQITGTERPGDHEELSLDKDITLA